MFYIFEEHVFVMIYESIDCMPDLKRLLTLVTSDGPFHLHVLHTLTQTSSFVNEPILSN